MLVDSSESVCGCVKVIEIKDLEMEVECYDTKLNIVQFEGIFTSVRPFLVESSVVVQRVHL